MKNLTSLALLLLCAIWLHAQSIIHKMEYWIDFDPGIGVATDISGFAHLAEVDHSFVVPVAGNTPIGLHTLGIRSQDNSGRWSHTNVFPAFVFKPLSNANIDRIEYWIDTDSNGFSFSIPVAGFNPSQEVNYMFTIPTNLSVGLHTIGIRSRNTEGKWSHTNVFPVFVFRPLSNAKINLIEYWFDRDSAGIAKSIPVTGFTQGQVVDYMFTIPANLSVGLHTIGIRSRNTEGKWSHTNYFPVYVVDSVKGVLTEVEIYWETETDPGFGASAHKTVFNAPLVPEFEDIILATTPPNLTLGTHNLYVRSKGTRGHYSHTNRLLVQVDSIVSAEDLGLQTGIKVFPNPFVEEITIVPSDDGKMRVTIYDQSGRLMGDVTVQGETTLDMASLSSGIYTAFFWKGGTRIYKMQLVKT